MTKVFYEVDGKHFTTYPEAMEAAGGSKYKIKALYIEDMFDTDLTTSYTAEEMYEMYKSNVNTKNC